MVRVKVRIKNWLRFGLGLVLQLGLGLGYVLEARV